MIKWILALLVFPSLANAGNYYISNNGNDNNRGTSAADSWKSINKLNSSFGNIHAGDTVFFKRGDLFYGSIIITSSGAAGKPIVFTAYGKGTDPVISGFSTITGWLKKEGVVWQAPAAMLKNNLNMVTLNGIPQRVGRYPNADAPDGGYLRYEKFAGGNSISDNELTNDINWTGAQIVVRKDHWTAERCRVTSQEGNTINFTYANTGINLTTALPSLHGATKGNGYFFQQDARTLDEPGEWFFDTTDGKLQMVFDKKDPSGNVIRASTIDILVNAGTMSFITISHLSFDGANRSAIYCYTGSDITIQYCSFTNMGAKAIHIWNTSNVVIDHVTTNYVLSNAIQVRNSKQDNVSVTNCVIKNTGTFIGMGSFFDDRDYKGIVASANNNLLIENNIVDTVGLSGIHFQGNNVMIKNNLVNYFCYLLDDGAGIYSFTAGTKQNPGEIYTNRVIKDNILLHGIGAPEGSTILKKAEGIYLDGRTMNVKVLDNTIAFVGNKAIATNNPNNITVLNNTCFNTSGWGTTKLETWENIKNLMVKHNIFYAVNDQQIQVNFVHSGLDVPAKVTIWEAIQLMGEIDSNYYNTINPAGFMYSYAPVAGKEIIYPSPLSLENWQALSKQDQHSKRPAKIIPLYVLKNTIGSNMISNGTLENEMKGVNVVGANTSGAQDNSGKLTGAGSLKIDFSVPEANRYGLIHSPVGNVQEGKKYIFRFNTAGATECGIVRAYLRQTSAPYKNLVVSQTQVFGISKQPHEFMFAVNKDDAASYVIEIEKNSGTTYIDDIELYEADASSVNIMGKVRFEYNPTHSPVSIPLDKKYVGVDGTPYKGTLKLEPFSSKILIADDF